MAQDTDISSASLLPKCLYCQGPQRNLKLDIGLAVTQASERPPLPASTLEEAEAGRECQAQSQVLRVGHGCLNCQTQCLFL